MAAASSNGRTVRTLIGGVGYRWLGDASFGLLASDRLAEMAWPAGIRVEDLGYGALYAAQDIAAAAPDRLILLAGHERGREPGRLYRYRWQPAACDEEELQARIREAGAGVIDLDHLLLIGNYFKQLPPSVLLFEVEPLQTDDGEALSQPVAALVPAVVRMVREEALSLPEEA